jgi:hypothetical protein
MQGLASIRVNDGDSLAATGLSLAMKRAISLRSSLDAAEYRSLSIN